MPHCIKWRAAEFQVKPLSRGYEKRRRVNSITWLSLDHLQVPSDKSLNRERSATSGFRLWR
jgi:hypothetical protein